MPITKPRSCNIAFRRDRIFSVLPLNVIKNLGTTICFVCQNIAVRQIKARQKLYSYLGIMDVSRCKQKLQRISKRICKCVYLGV